MNTDIEVYLMNKSISDYNNYPNNLIRFATEGQMRQSRLLIESSDEAIHYASELIETGIKNVLDDESAQKVIDLFKGNIKWGDIDKPFAFCEWLKGIFKGALGMPSERAEILKNATFEEQDLYDELRVAFIQAHVALNARAYPQCILDCCEIYPEVALKTDRLEEVVEYLRVVTVEETGEDYMKEIKDKAEDPDKPAVKRDHIDYIQNLFERYAGTAVMSVDRSIFEYTRDLEKKLREETEYSQKLISNIEYQILQQLGTDAKIDICGKTPIERAQNDGKITIKIAINMDHLENDKTPSGLPHADVMVMLCGKENVQFLPKQEGYLPYNYLTGKIEI